MIKLLDLLKVENLHKYEIYVNIVNIGISTYIFYKLMQSTINLSIFLMQDINTYVNINNLLINTAKTLCYVFI